MADAAPALVAPHPPWSASAVTSQREAPARRKKSVVIRPTAAEVEMLRAAEEEASQEARAEAEERWRRASCEAGPWVARCHEDSTSEDQPLPPTVVALAEEATATALAGATAEMAAKVEAEVAADVAAQVAAEAMAVVASEAMEDEPTTDESETDCRSWITRVPSRSNISDGPSRGDREECQKAFPHIKWLDWSDSMEEADAESWLI